MKQLQIDYKNWIDIAVHKSVIRNRQSAIKGDKKKAG